MSDSEDFELVNPQDEEQQPIVIDNVQVAVLSPSVLSSVSPPILSSDCPPVLSSDCPPVLSSASPSVSSSAAHEETKAVVSCASSNETDPIVAEESKNDVLPPTNDVVPTNIQTDNFAVVEALQCATDTINMSLSSSASCSSSSISYSSSIVCPGDSCSFSIVSSSSSSSSCLPSPIEPLLNVQPARPSFPPPGFICAGVHTKDGCEPDEFLADPSVMRDLDSSVGIVLLGASGGGKTTLLQMLHNFFSKKDYENKESVSIKNNEAGYDASFVCEQKEKEKEKEEKEKEKEKQRNQDAKKDWRKELTKSRQAGKKEKPTSFLESIYEALRVDQFYSDTMTSATASSCSYLYRSEKNHIVRILDTPGLVDSKGLGQDMINIRKTLQAIVDAKRINALILVIKDDNRITAQTRYLASQIRNILPTSVLKKVTCLITHCQKLGTCRFNKKVLQELIHPDIKFFHVNNTAWPTIQELNDEKQFLHEEETPEEKEARLAKNETSRKTHWLESMTTIKIMTRAILSISRLDVSEFAQIQNVRNRIMMEVNVALMHLTNLRVCLAKMMSAKKKAKLTDDGLLENKNYIEPNKVWVSEQYTTSHYNTICLRCKRACHEACGLDLKLEQRGEENNGNGGLAGCYCFFVLDTWGRHQFDKDERVIVSSTCRVCDCNLQQHYSERIAFRQVEKSVENAIKKALYEKHVNDKQTVIEVIKENETMLDKLKQSFTSVFKEIGMLCIQMKQVCKTYNLAHELRTIVQLLEEEVSSIMDIKMAQQATHQLEIMLNLVDCLTQDSANIDLTAIAQNYAAELQ